MTALDDYLEPLGAPDWAADDFADALASADSSKQPYTLPDDAAADWALRKIAKAQAAIDAAEQMRDERVALAQQWCRDATASDRSTVEFFNGLLEEYGRAVREADNDRATIDLPAGRIKTTKPSKPSVVLGDKDALVEWARKHLPDLVETETVYKVGANDVKKHVEVRGDRVVLPNTETGEFVDVDGLAVRPVQITAKVEVS